MLGSPGHQIRARRARPKAESFPLLPAGRNRNGRITRATMNKEDNRIVTIFAANLNPLIDAAEVAYPSWTPFGDWIARARAEVLPVGAKSKS
jgi:hypothetical protein